jgi:Ala-tRNA(Pro) deacylase
MAIALTLQKFLAQKGIAYDTLHHRHTETSLNSATAAHVPAGKMAKSVILEDDNGYLMAVIPATHHVKIGKLNHVLGRHMGLATESELKALFSDCDIGAIPPIGQAYGIDTIVDDSLTNCSDIYFEAGDHEDLIHLKGSSFHKLMKHSQHANIS